MNAKQGILTRSKRATLRKRILLTFYHTTSSTDRGVSLFPVGFVGAATVAGQMERGPHPVNAEFKEVDRGCF